MYEFLSRGAIVSDDPRAVIWHRGKYAELLTRHHDDVKRVLPNGLRGLRSLAPYLLERIADASTLRVAWDDLARRGGPAPGPNGRCYTDYSSAEVWGLCRCLAQALRAGKYGPGPEQLAWIEKSSGNGTRPLVLQNIQDRVVQRGIYLILNRLLDSLFGSHSLGFRENRGPLHALALAEHLTCVQKRFVWLTADIKDAFQHVPLSRLLQVVEKLLPDTRLLDLLERVLPGYELPGLRQGGSLSPLMLNLYLHWHCDHAWQRDHPGTPLIRFADDLLGLCRTPEEAANARVRLEHYLVPAGFTLKPAQKPISALEAGGTADWLGFAISKPGRGLAAGITARAWKSLEQQLALAHSKANAQSRAIEITKQWLIQRSPCYRWSDRDEVCEMVVTLAKKYAFAEVPASGKLKRYWKGAADRCRSARCCRWGSRPGSPARH
ncbi:reverse transcriptase domain-containing protein [Frigoriglobus tundricola]|uniref:Reverse transcriptase domain-containing protein n=1 Tax=Frigoriglobus tundricola TaxID=2774151 RepID=A0A6M5YIH8_9BACT|nr:reverse transcriptase domain-containing protein [Frigoriglobus tundricola]QJW93130.1 hypothetical protein FTUN_0633 [Frigoriglobus tundricola]